MLSLFISMHSGSIYHILITIFSLTLLLVILPSYLSSEKFKSSYHQEAVSAESSTDPFQFKYDYHLHHLVGDYTSQALSYSVPFAGLVYNYLVQSFPISSAASISNHLMPFSFPILFADAADYCSDFNVPPCALKIDRDLLYVLDASESMDPDRFFKEAMDFILSMYCAFSTENTNYVGLILFSDKIDVVVPLGQRTRDEWKAVVEAIRADKNNCCTCCTPTAEALVTALTQFKSKGRPKVAKIAFVISDGLPYQNKQKSKYGWPGMKFAEYKYIAVPSVSMDLKKAGVRVVYLGVPNKQGLPPNTDYFAGIPDPAKVPKKSTNPRLQCETRSNDDSCEEMKESLFPITSIPTELNLFSTNTWDVNTIIGETVEAICLVLPTTAPTRNPVTPAPTTKSPIPRPTTKPTTSGPTRVPTLRPTLRPTTQPSFNPTLKPTFRPSVSPTKKPTLRPTLRPTLKPTMKPTLKPTEQPTVEPTNAPSKRPTLKPTTTSPTLRPTRKPTVQPTRQPTKFPTLDPTLKPTIQPTKRPTTSPTESPVVPDLDHLDLYLLLDLSGSMLDHQALCASVIVKDPDAVLDGTSASKCWQLFLSFSLKLSIEVAKLGRFGPMGWQGNNKDPSKGLRINVVGFACSSNQKVPQVYDIIQFANTFDSFYSQIQDAAKKYLPQGGTCPSEAIDLVSMRIMLQDRLVRPFQAALILTDGVFYDAPAPATASQSLVFFKVQTYAIGIAIPNTPGYTSGLSPDETRQQLEQLRSFVNHVPGRVFNLGADAFSVLEELAIGLAKGLPSQFNRKAIGTFDKWCGFTSRFACLYANGFDDYCRWFPAKGLCYPRTYCESFLPAKCNSLPGFCKWDAANLRCKTLGSSNDGATVAPVGIFYTNFPTSTTSPSKTPTVRPTQYPTKPQSQSPTMPQTAQPTQYPTSISQTKSPTSLTSSPVANSPTKFPTIPTLSPAINSPTGYPTIPTLMPTTGSTTKSPTSPTSPGLCQWTTDTYNYGGEYTPRDTCSSKTASYGCKYKNYCCWSDTTGTCKPPKSCPECTAFGSQTMCNQQPNCCYWNTAISACNRRCLGVMEEVCAQ